jgi:hypothetical protein
MVHEVLAYAKKILAKFITKRVQNTSAILFPTPTSPADISKAYIVTVFTLILWLAAYAYHSVQIEQIFNKLGIKC